MHNSSIVFNESQQYRIKTYFSSHMKRNNNSVLISGFDDMVNFSYYVNTLSEWF